MNGTKTKKKKGKTMLIGSIFCLILALVLAVFALPVNKKGGKAGIVQSLVVSLAGGALSIFLAFSYGQGSPRSFYRLPTEKFRYIAGATNETMAVLLVQYLNGKFWTFDTPEVSLVIGLSPGKLYRRGQGLGEPILVRCDK